MNPYETPKITPAPQITLKSGSGKLTGTYHLTASSATGTTSTSDSFIRFVIVPEWCLPASLWITVITALFVGPIALFIYLGSYTLFNMFAQRPVEVKAAAQNWIKDSERKICGFTKQRKGRKCFIAFTYDSRINHGILGIVFTEKRISRASTWPWHVAAILISILVTIIGIRIGTLSL